MNIDPSQANSNENHVSTQPPAGSKLRRHKIKLYIIVAVLVILTITIVSALVMYSLGKNSKESMASDDSAIEKFEIKEAANLPKLKPQEAIAKVEQAYKSKYHFVSAETSSEAKAGEVRFMKNEQTPAYKVDGYNFYTRYSDTDTSLFTVPPPKASQEDSTPTDVIYELRDLATATFKGLGLQLHSAIAPDVGPKVTTYEGRGIICSIETDIYEIIIAVARCGSESEYQKASQNIKTLASKLPDLTQTTVLGNLNIKDSVTPGYKHANLSQSDIMNSYFSGNFSTAYFYKNSSEWKYIGNYKGKIECAKMDDDNIRLALIGELCELPSTENLVIE